MKSASSILMVRPCAFGYNSDTATTNSFQHTSNETDVHIQSQALSEFSRFAAKLESSSIEVKVFDDTPIPHTPDSIFPNNWISTHPDGTVVIYPMAHESRRHEVRQDIIDFTLNRATQLHGRSQLIDLRELAGQGEYLEGTGSMILDHGSRIAYVARSGRSSSSLLRIFCERLNFRAVEFSTKAIDELPVYHTNVLMALGESLAVVCSEIILLQPEASLLHAELHNSGRRVLEISYDQMLHFAGNMIQLRNRNDELCWVLSEQAWNCLRTEQQRVLSSEAHIIRADLSTIESLGGGSARCMIAELF